MSTIRIPEEAYKIIEGYGALSGELFETDEQVRQYFTIANIQEMFGPDTEVEQADLDDAARWMIEAGLHMERLLPEDSVAHIFQHDPSGEVYAVLAHHAGGPTIACYGPMVRHGAATMLDLAQWRAMSEAAWADAVADAEWWDGQAGALRDEEARDWATE